MQDARQARAVARHLERIGDRISIDLERHLYVEFGRLKSNERAAAIDGVADALARASFDYEALASVNFDDVYLARALIAHKDALLLSEAGSQFFDLLARECAAYVVSAALAMPDFSARVGVTLLRREAEAYAAIDDALTRLPKRLLLEIDEKQAGRAQVEAEKFELEYRRHLVRRLDRLTLYGVDASDSVGRSYPLSVAYVSLTMTNRSGGSSSSPVRVEDALEQARARRFVIAGDAGSGKTTILQWLAVQAASRSFTGALARWNTLVPFLIQLRTYAEGRRLPSPTNFLVDSSPIIADRAPPKWASARLHDGHALLLIDGLDELPPARRREIDTWLRDLVTEHPFATYILTTRPTALRDVDMSDRQFHQLWVEPMNAADVAAFIDHWHRAASRAVVDSDDAQALVDYQSRLSGVLTEQAAVRRLATNPLLCALLCVMNRERRGLVPHGRTELYSTALSMLLRRRDMERGVESVLPQLGESETLLLLQDLAYWMLRNGRAQVPLDTATTRLERRLESLPHVTADAGACVRYLLDRSGVLREPIEGQLDFVHLTFQEFLAAKELTDQDDIGELLAQVHAGRWSEVAINVAGLGSARQRNELIGQLVHDEEPRGHLLALVCLGVSSSLDPALASEVIKRGQALIPPRSVEEARAVAAAGPVGLALLADVRPEEITDDESAAAVIRSVAVTGGEKGLAVLARWTSDQRIRVQEEILRAWSSFDAGRFADLVLSSLVPAESLSREMLVGPLQAPHLAGIAWLESVIFEGAGTADVPTALPPTLDSLVIRNTSAIHLGGLGGESAVDELIIEHSPNLVSLHGVETLDRLQRVTLHNLSGLTSLEPLPSLPSLERVQASRLPLVASVPDGRWTHLSELLLEDCASIASIGDTTAPSKLRRLVCRDVPLKSLRTLRSMANLTHVVIRFARPLVSLDGIDGALLLTKAEFRDCYELADISALAELPELQELVLHNCPVLRDLAPIADLPRITELELDGCSSLASVSPIARIAGLVRVSLRGCPMGLDYGCLADVPDVEFPFPA